MPHKPITKLFNEHTVRSTAAQRPVNIVPIILPRGRAFFRVRNGHNQILTVEIIASSFNDPAGAGLTGATAAIPANTTQAVVTDIWAPYLGLEARYAVAPTSGDLTIEGEGE